MLEWKKGKDKKGEQKERLIFTRGFKRPTLSLLTTLRVDCGLS